MQYPALNLTSVPLDRADPSTLERSARLRTPTEILIQGEVYSDRSPVQSRGAPIRPGANQPCVLIGIFARRDCCQIRLPDFDSRSAGPLCLVRHPHPQNAAPEWHVGVAMLQERICPRGPAATYQTRAFDLRKQQDLLFQARRNSFPRVDSESFRE
jgi:hypothetical protein